MKIPHFERVLRTVAIFEASKGAVGLLIGLGGLKFLKGTVRETVEAFISHFHLDPNGHMARIFLDLASKITDTHLWMFASLLALWVTVRFVEAYGLWRARPWAEWLAALSGGIYIPYELFEISKHVNVWTIGTLTINVLIVAFMVYALRHRKEIQAEMKQQQQME